MEKPRDWEPLAAASIGQVYRARLNDGEPVVVKVQRPAIAEAVERDIDVLLELAATAEARAPWAAEGVNPGDRQRVVRALELLEAGELEPPVGESELWTSTVRRATLLVGLTMDRHELYARIDARVEAMLRAGAEDEVRRANAVGASLTARKALGFEDLLAGDVERMKRRTRNYAKRQLTWMRKLGGVRVLDVSGREPEAVAREILDSGAR